MAKHLIDIETYLTHWELSVKDYETKEAFDFQCNEFRDDRLAAKQYIRSFDGFSIGFNSLKYDWAVMAYCDMNNYWLDQSWDVFCRECKAFSDALITTDDDLFVYKYVNYKQFKFQIVDLYLYWAKLLRLSKKISLKALGIQMGYPVVQELPYPPDIQELTKEQIDEIHHYCSIHDLGILEMLTVQLEGVPGQTTIPLGNLGTIALRNQVKKDFGIDCFSMDAPKIASEALINEYCRLTGHNKKEFTRLRFDKPTIKFGDLFKDMVFDFKTNQFKSIFNEWMNSTKAFDKQWLAIPKTAEPVKISAGIGGLHSILTNRLYMPKDDEIILDVDIESLYPTFIMNFKAFRFSEMLDYYGSIKHFRVTETKPALKKVKGTPEEAYWKNRDLFYKVVLNGISGHLDSENSPLYYPEGIMKVRCGGQLVLLKLIEQCIIADMQVLQANTDGITVKIKKNREDEFRSFVTESEEQYNVKYEYAYYQKMVFSNVNSYLAIDDYGKIKQKGEFVTEPELGNSTDNLIIPLALNEYFINGTDPREFIKDPKHHIYLFCMSKKADKSYQVFHNSKKQQRLNRYYASLDGAYLYKCRYDEKKSAKKKKQVESLFDADEFKVSDKVINPATGIPFGMSGSHMLSESGVTIYNNHVEKPISEYNVNYPFYVSQVMSKIAEIELNN